jgi:hypothetical protein
MLSVPFLSIILLGHATTWAYAVPLAHEMSNATVAKRQGSGPGWIPYYNATANGHTSAVRGWNTFGLQANQALYPVVGFDFNDYHFANQCDQIITRPGYDYVCSIDSGWSKDGGDRYGRIEPNPKIFPWFGFKGPFVIR